MAPKSFVVNAGIQKTQTLLNVLFNKIPQLSYIPNVQKTTHSSTTTGELDTPEAVARAAQLKKFQGPLIIRRPANSFFEESRHLWFKELIHLEASTLEPKLYSGYPSIDFEHISARSEAEVA